MPPGGSQKENAARHPAFEFHGPRKPKTHQVLKDCIRVLTPEQIGAESFGPNRSLASCSCECSVYKARQFKCSELESKDPNGAAVPYCGWYGTRLSREQRRAPQRTKECLMMKGK